MGSASSVIPEEAAQISIMRQERSSCALARLIPPSTTKYFALEPGLSVCSMPCHCNFVILMSESKCRITWPESFKFVGHSLALAHLYRTPAASGRIS